MVRAIYRTQRWVAAADRRCDCGRDRAILPRGAARRFSAMPVRATSRVGIWGGDPRLPRTGYDRLRASLVSGGFVSPGTPYEVAVDNSLADAVVAENPPPLQ